jgi:hypothetical protein
MVDNDNDKRRRLVEFKDGCRYGKFGKTKAYELINHERISVDQRFRRRSRAKRNRVDPRVVQHEVSVSLGVVGHSGWVRMTRPSLDLAIFC